MAAFLQIMFVNLAVSCDNIGVIALATRRLPAKQAKIVSRLGIGLSLLLKLVFIGLIGFLFNIPWLHIRIIGGLLLIYVVHSMLKESQNSTPPDTSQTSHDQLLFALVSIIATDISMSLDNVIAILSIVSSDGSTLDTKSFLLIFAGLLVCVPILLWCSQTVSGLITRFPILTYLCAGYLFYTAVNMIFEDELVSLFLDSIHFTITTPVAILSGFAVVAGSTYINNVNSSAQIKTRKRLVKVYVIAALDALVTLGMITYLSTNPIKEGVRLSVESFFRFTPTGANALYTIGRSPHLVALCACFIVAIVIGEDNCRSMTPSLYLKKLFQSIQTIILFIVIDITAATVGLTIMFGFGEISPFIYSCYLLMQVVLYCSYVSIFCMYKVFVKRKSIMIIVSMISIHIEIELVELFMVLGKWPLFTGYMPGRYVHNIPQPVQSIDPVMLFRILLCSVICILFTTWIGCLYCSKKNL